MKQLEFKVTTKGTQLPLLNLKGKPYLQVAYRVVWFREDHPDGRIDTSPIKIEEEYAIMHAKVYDKNGNLLGAGTKRESIDNFMDFLEKAETGAIGRALALAGYGTQFEPALDEEERIVDSPVQMPSTAKVESAKPLVDLSKIKANIKAMYKLLNAQGTMTKEAFIDKYLEPNGVVKVDDLLETNALRLQEQLKKDYPQLA